MVDKILSVIVPSYNMEKYLPKCLGSLVVAPEQLERLEVLVVNDGSKDRTSEIAHEFAERYPNTFKVIDKANGHYGSCINAALKRVTGTFVKVLDADDLFDSVAFGKFISRLLDFQSSGQEIEVVLTDYVEVDELGCDLAVKSFCLQADCALSLQDVRNHFYIPMHSVAYRTELLRRISYVQTEGVAYTDTEWVARPIASASRFCYLELPVYRYLLGREGQSVSQASLAKSLNQYRKVAYSLLRQFQDYNNNLSQDGRLFLRDCVVRISQLVYRIGMFNAPIGEGEQVLKAFDARLRDFSEEIYQAMEDDCFSPRIRFSHVRLWRRLGCFRNMLICTLRVHLWLRQ